MRKMPRSSRGQAAWPPRRALEETQTHGGIISRSAHRGGGADTSVFIEKGVSLLATQPVTRIDKGKGIGAAKSADSVPGGGTPWHWLNSLGYLHAGIVEVPTTAQVSKPVRRECVRRRFSWHPGGPPTV
jgi:hypothetical protein